MRASAQFDKKLSVTRRLWLLCAWRTTIRRSMHLATNNAKVRNVELSLIVESHGCTLADTFADFYQLIPH